MTSVILKHVTDYEIYFSHQSDDRPFNRGATKNIGFLAMKSKYPNDYKNITFIFNDVDTMPFTNMFSYETTPGVVKHYYGFTYALGGIVVMKGEDFERINGYPCYWGWGNEDNCLQTRCLKNKISIDRSEFFHIGNPNILQLFDGISRLINKTDAWRSVNDTGLDGLSTISQLDFTIDTQSNNANDNLYVISSNKIFYVNIKTFTTVVTSSTETYHKYDLRDPPTRIIQPNQLDMVITTDNDSGSRLSTIHDWTNIPEYTKPPPSASKYPKKSINKPIESVSKSPGISSVSPNIQNIPNPLINYGKKIVKKKQLLFI
jgi:hypothetical protein